MKTRASSFARMKRIQKTGISTLPPPSDGFMLRKKDDTSNFTFNAVAMVRTVLDSLGIEKGASFIISNNPEEINGEKFYYIITKNPIGVV